jgi:D-aminoacyl-tRNA deacylase
MDCLVYSRIDAVAVAVAERIFKKVDFELLAGNPRYKHYLGEKINVVEINEPSVNAHFLDSEVPLAERFIFISRHASGRGITSFTAHALGNWSDSNDFGGRPNELGVASPKYMLKFLNAVRMGSRIHHGMHVTYEATHHGPLLQKPSLFIEFGPVVDDLDTKIADVFADGAIETIRGIDPHFDKVALGIGGTHYADKFTYLATSGRCAFSHIMPKYYAGRYEMIGKAVERTELPIDLAVIDWKSINALQRNAIIKELDRLGIDYERV